MRARLRSGALLLGLLLAGLLLLQVDARARQERKSWPVEEQYVTLPPPSAARLVSLGYNELVADITWTRMLVYYGSGFLGKGDFRYLSQFIKNIIALDPKFKRLYSWAMYAVTISENHRVSSKEEDIRESIAIIERAMIEFPDEYEFFWIAGIRYFLDLKSSDPVQARKDKERGSQLIELAMEKPNAPPDLATTAASLRSQLGQFEQARANLTKMILTTNDPKARAKMLASFKNIADAGLAEELELATELFEELRGPYMQLRADLFILMNGPAPDPVIDFADLATDRDLFGSQQDGQVVLF